MNKLTQDAQLMQTKAVMSVLDSWNLGTEEMKTILGLPKDLRARNLQKFRTHQAFPEDPKIQRRIDYLLRIVGALRTTYPTNPGMGAQWLRKIHRRLECTPLSKMLEGDEAGLRAVLAELDCTFCWDLSGSKSG